MADDSYESVLLVLKECTAYRIPPRASAKGYKASDWDVNSFLWKGRLRIITKGDDCYISLEDSTTGELFAACPYPPDGSSVEPVLDSSRYFVLTLVDKASGRKAYIGMGFEERSSAFDFNVALQDYAKRARGGSAQPTAAKQATQQPAIDFSLKGDQTFSIKIGGLGTKKVPTDADASAFGVLPPPPSGGGAFIPPPPAPLHSHSHISSSVDLNDPFAVLAKPATSVGTGLNLSNDDWANFGDFQDASAGATDPNGWAKFE